MGKGGESEACGYAFHANHHQRGKREKGRRRHLLVTLLLVEKKRVGREGHRKEGIENTIII